MTAMKTQTATTPIAPRTTSSGIVPYRLTVRQFEKMIEAGIFRETDHVELLGGILVDKMTKHDPHNFAVGALGDKLHPIVGAAWVICEEKPILLGAFSRPEPDAALARGPRDRYRSATPRPADLGMLIEVSDSSYAKDRGKKWRQYASARIPVYWIVHLSQAQIEVYTEPSGTGRSASYLNVAIYGRDDQVPVILEGKELGRFVVRDVLS